MYRKLPKDETGRELKIVQRIEDMTSIAFDESSSDYQRYLAWLAEGNEPLPADAPPAE
jgi:hypothetical protein